MFLLTVIDFGLGVRPINLYAFRLLVNAQPMSLMDPPSKFRTTLNPHICLLSPFTQTTEVRFLSESRLIWCHTDHSLGHHSIQQPHHVMDNIPNLYSRLVQSV